MTWTLNACNNNFSKLPNLLVNVQANADYGIHSLKVWKTSFHVASHGKKFFKPFHNYSTFCLVFYFEMICCGQNISRISLKYEYRQTAYRDKEPELKSSMSDFFLYIQNIFSPSLATLTMHSFWHSFYSHYQEFFSPYSPMICKKIKNNRTGSPVVSWHFYAIYGSMITLSDMVTIITFKHN